MKGANLETCVVRLEDENGQTRGTGFVVSPSLAVTCAHVVEACGAGPGERVRLVFHAGGEPVEAEVITNGWHPEADVAFLRLARPLPEGVLPVTLGPATGSSGHRYLALGYPEDGEVQARWPQGRIGGIVSVADCKTDLLQVQGVEVDRGLSGAPVLDLDADRIVGMLTGYKDLVRSQDSPQVRFAYAIPAEALRDLCPEKLALQPTDVYFQERRLFGVPFQAPTVPRYFVPRPEVSQALMDYLTSDAPPGALVVSAVHGLGGIGKTTLVAALAHNPDVQARFPDGILWAMLGQQPDVLSLLVGWIQALGDYDFRPTVVEMASSHLRTLLHDKACLLVVDDAWQADHVRPFLVGGPHCRLVVTTRNAALARKVGARLYDLDVMTEAQALALFEARLGPLDGDREQAEALARELGYLPLALELAAAQVEAGFSWAELLDTFRQALADLAALDLDEATYRNESLRLSFRLSLEQLASDDQEAFAWLGTLAENARLNPAMAATLWDQPEADARKRLRRLRDRALLKSVGEDRYTLHDLLHDEAKLRLAKQIPLPEAHVALLERYRQKVPGEQWQHLPDDGYVHEHLTWHLEQAEQPEAIHALLRLETTEGRNAWYEAREALGQTSGYLDDVRRAWRLANAETPLPECGRSVGKGVRYALIVTSLNSLAEKIPPDLLVALVEWDVWTLAQGLAYARQVPEPGQRAEALAELSAYLPGVERVEVLEEALAAARVIRDTHDRAEALARLTPRLPEAERIEVLEETLAAAQTIDYAGARALALAELAPHLPEALSREALPTVRALPKDELWSSHRVHALAGLVSHLPEAERAEVLEEALAAARAIKWEWWRAGALAGLAPRLAELGRPEEALATAQAIELEGARAKTLAGLAPHLPELLLREAMALAREIKYEEYRAGALAGLAPHLPEAERAKALEEALAAARAIESKDDRARALAGLAPHLPEAERAKALQEALAAARAIESKDDRARALARLASHLPEALIEALAATRVIRDTDDQGHALGRLSSHLPETERVEALKEVLAAAREVGSEQWRVEALVELAPHLPQAERAEILEEALVTAKAMPDAYDRVEALALLAPRLARMGYPKKALVAARSVKNGGDLTKVLAGLTSHLPEADPFEIMREAMAMQVIEYRGDGAKVLAELAPHLPEAERIEALREALAAAQAIEFEWERAEALAGLAPQLPERLLGEALAVARAIKNEYRQVEALAVLAPYLPELLRTQTLQEALAAARAIEHADVRSVALTKLAPHLPEAKRAEVLEEALAAVRASELELCRVEALVRLAPHLVEAERARALEEALTAAWAIEWEDSRAEMLTKLAPHLVEAKRIEALREALAAARAIEREGQRVEGLTRLAPHLAQFPRQHLYTLWQETLPILAARTRKDLLADLCALEPVIAALGGAEAAAETFRVIQDVGRWWP